MVAVALDTVPWHAATGDLEEREEREEREEMRGL